MLTGRAAALHAAHTAPPSVRQRCLTPPVSPHQAVPCGQPCPEAARGPATCPRRPLAHRRPSSGRPPRARGAACAIGLGLRGVLRVATSGRSFGTRWHLFASSARTPRREHVGGAASGGPAPRSTCWWRSRRTSGGRALPRPGRAPWANSGRVRCTTRRRVGSSRCTVALVIAGRSCRLGPAQPEPARSCRGPRVLTARRGEHGRPLHRQPEVQNEPSADDPCLSIDVRTSATSRGPPRSSPAPGRAPLPAGMW
jgi:hypothetical protein